MRRLLGGAAACVIAVALAGCGRSEATTPESKTPEKDPYAAWPKDNLRAPATTSTVDAEVDKVVNDAESSRIPCTFLVPDWADPLSDTGFKSPKGARIEVHYLESDPQTKKLDDNDLAKHTNAKDLIVARPWRGWFGEANTAHAEGLKSIPHRMRVYTFVNENRHLELHVEWPTGNKAAQGEADHLMRSVLFSIKDK